MSPVEIALKVNKLIHDECKDVQHDIGGRIVFELLKDNIKTERDELLIKIGTYYSNLYMILGICTNEILKPIYQQLENVE